MVILIVSDCQTKATRLRHLLAQVGCDCPLSNVLPIDAVESAAGGLHPKPDLVLFVLSHDPERSQAAVQLLRDASDAPVLAIGPRDPNLILGALHAGASNYIDESGDVQAELASTFSRLSTSEQRQTATGRLTSVVAASGGSGRTLVATNLAVALAKRQERCCLIDLDLAGADVATCLNIKPRHSIADLCRNIEKLDQKMFEQSLVEHASGVFVLAGPETWDEARQVTVDGLQKILRLARTAFTDVVVDIDPFGFGDCGPILQQSSAVILLLRLDFAAIRNARRALSAFDRLGIERGKVIVAANRCGRPKEICVAQAETALGTKIRHCIPEDAQTVNSCVNCGVPPVIESAWSAIAKAFNAIATSVAAQPTVSNPADRNGRGGINLAARVRSFLGMSLQELAH